MLTPEITAFFAEVDAPTAGHDPAALVKINADLLAFGEKMFAQARQWNRLLQAAEVAGGDNGYEEGYQTLRGLQRQIAETETGMRNIAATVAQLARYRKRLEEQKTPPPEIAADTGEG